MRMGAAKRVIYVINMQGRLKNARSIARMLNFYSSMKMVGAAASRVATMNDLSVTIIVQLMCMRNGIQVCYNRSPYIIIV